jgi:glutamate formiminotransferase
MPYPLEAVPNFSEGRERSTIDALADVLGTRSRLLDVHSDPDHNRTVFTLAGEADELVQALVAGVELATRLIDLRAHEGVHPCVGVADVLPLVAVRPEDVDRAREAAGDVAKRIGDELGVPVFLYGPAGGHGLAELRRGGPTELARRIESGELEPDFGPARLDPRTGAVLVTARRPLVAFNVNLRGSLEAAKEIAAAVREGGASGFEGVRALGLQLRSAGLVQVSMNVEDWKASALHEIVECIEREAAARGAEVAGSELVGLIPEGAALEAARSSLRLDRIERSQVLEARLREPNDDPRR